MLQIITHLDLGGAEKVAMDLAGALRGRAGFIFLAVLRHDRPGPVGRLMEDDLRRWGMPLVFGTGRGFKSGGVLIAAWAVIRAVRRHRPDVVHLHTEIPELTYAIACLLSPHVRRTPLLRTVHNSRLWIAWAGVGRWVTQRLAHGEAVSVSEKAADADQAITTRHVRPRASVIPNGVHPPSPGRGAKAHKPVRILFAGRLVEQKGADLLPAILESAYRRIPEAPVEVVIAGSGPMRDAIAGQLAGRLPGWSVRMDDPIAQLSAHLHHYDVVLMPSRFEGFGLLGLEALMAGVALVTTDAPGLDEVIPADYPLRARVDDVDALALHLATVIANPVDHKLTAAAVGARLAVQFDPARMADAYLARYEALARRGAANRGTR